MTSVLYPVILLIPSGIMALLLKMQERNEAEKGLQLPIESDERFLRSPGESALKRKKEFDEEILNQLLFLFTSPPIAMVSYLSISAKERSSLGFWLVWGIALPVYLWFFVKALLRLPPLLNERQTWHLGFRGERAVGEYLNQLMLDGCRVFHDFPLDDNGKGNLDHIVVARSGIYAIETKAKSKRPCEAEHGTIKFDGEKLIFANGKWDLDDLRQAASQAAKMHDELYKRLGIDVWVNAILVLPGWEVERTGRGIVNVLKHTELQEAIVGDKRVLSHEAIKKISAYLDHKCRDVAF